MEEFISNALEGGAWLLVVRGRRKEEKATATVVSDGCSAGIARHLKAVREG